MNVFTEEMVPAYSNLGLTTTSIYNYKVDHMSWEPGESPPNHHENCDTPFAFFHSHSVDHLMEDKLPTVCVKLQGDHMKLLQILIIICRHRKWKA